MVIVLVIVLTTPILWVPMIDTFPSDYVSLGFSQRQQKTIKFRQDKWKCQKTRAEVTLDCFVQVTLA